MKHFSRPPDTEPEERMRSVIDHVVDGIITINAHGIVTTFNPAAERIFGYKSTDVIGQNVKVLMPEPYHSEHDGYILNYLRTGKAKIIGTGREVVGRRGDGSVFPMELAISAFRLGEDRYFTGIVRDITERKRAEAELRNAEERMRSVVNHVVDGIISINDRGIVTTFNPAAERIFGYRSDEVIGQNVKMLMPEPYRGEHDAYIGNYLRTGQAKIIGIGREVVGRRKDGGSFPMELAISEFRLGAERYFTGIVRDITERKRAEQELRDAGERMGSVVNHVVDGIITIDERGKIESYNPAAEKIFGYSSAEVLGQNVKMLMPEPYHSEHDAYVQNYVRTGNAKIIGIGREVVGQRKDGSTFPMELAVSAFHIGARRYFTGIVRDITERKRLQDDVQRRVHDLADADRQKNEFLAMLSHELRNPLAPMRNALHLMRLSVPENGDLHAAHAMMERQLQHLVRLVDDLLDVSRIIRGKIDLRRERIDLRLAASRAVETAKPILDANGHVLDADLPEAAVWVMGDLVRLSQVISNLLTNAAKYTRTPSRIRLTLRREGGGASVSVVDPGEGIAPDLLPRIFDLFVQGDHALARSQGGLGIGLTLVKRLVEMHDGTVWVASEGPGRGSEFTVRLPVLPEPTEHAATRGPRRGAGASGPSRRVLVVDDNLDAADSIRKILDLYGHQVRAAYDGRTALTVAEDFHPEVVVLDIGLPGMDGYEVARRLRSMPATRSARIVAVTGYGQEEDRQRSREAGFDQHMTKPVDPDTLNSFVTAHEKT
jgi:PAS domain S-box-containing protein